MVNYCYIQTCGRNSRTHNHLNFYSFPKENTRLLEWVKAIGRKDLLQKDAASLAELLRFNRICSRHFEPSAVRKKKGLMPDAAPTLCLAGSTDEEDVTQNASLTHEDIFCDNCSRAVVGYRYKCVTCPDFDLCQKCEMTEVHPDHYMLRIPKPMKYKFADNLTKKWRQLFKSEHVTPKEESEAEYSCLESSSDDDQPITKYARNYDSGVELSDDVKATIRKEINRVLNMTPEEKNKIAASKKNEQKKRQAETDRDNDIVKRMKSEEDARVQMPTVEAPEVVFADVNEIKDIPMVETKPEFSEYMPEVASVSSLAPEANTQQPMQVIVPPTMIPISELMAAMPTEVLVTPIMNQTGVPSLTVANMLNDTTGGDRPMMHVKLSDDLQELMIEVTSHNQKTIYKYQ